MKHCTILLCAFVFYGFVYSERPSVVNIGAIFTFDSVIGRVAKTAIEAAVSDINSNPGILQGTELNLIMEDVNCSVFSGYIAALQVLEKEVVAIIGPQSSGIAHMISGISNALQIPLVSFAATDPSLSALEFPFFVRTIQSDSSQMAAMADLIDYYQWKEIIAIFVDDYNGRNGISALQNELEKRSSKISYRLPIPVQIDETHISNLLNSSKSFGPRVYVVHLNPDPNLRIFGIANKLQMMTSEYVWLTSDWLSTTYDSFYSKRPTSLNLLQGVVGFRQHTSASRKKSALSYRWKEMLHKGVITSGLNSYGFSAYDTVWTIAYSVDKFIDEVGNFTFSFNHDLVHANVTDSLLGKVKVLNGGTLLLKKILEANFTGLSGQVLFDQSRNIIRGCYDVINFDHIGMNTVGYWSSYSGFSITRPEIRELEHNISRLDQKLGDITWPGGKTEKPRGWGVAINKRPLVVGVPRRISFTEFVTEIPDSHRIAGYCIDIFNESLKLLPYDVPYKLELFGDGVSNPNYNKLVKMAENAAFDVVVGDIAITTYRTKIVDFSQPYAATGLVIVAPIHKPESSAWVFLKPFTLEMWCVIAASFVIIAVVIWILEHRVNTEFRGPPRRQLITICLFTLSTLYKRSQESTLHPMGKMVLVVWFFVLMVITSSYTANLTSIITVRQLSSPITGINSLIENNSPIGYQAGSFAYSYLSESLSIQNSRLVPLGSPEEYEEALRRGPRNGGVAAIVDELPYVELFLSNRSDFRIIGQSFTKTGWGFAFQRGSSLAVDISTAILELSESGKLQNIHDKWFCRSGGCPGDRVQDEETEKLEVISFWGLYLLCGASTLIAIFAFLLRAIRQFLQYERRQRECSPSRTSHCHLIHKFIDFIDKKEEAIKKKFTQSENGQPLPKPTSST